MKKYLMIFVLLTISGTTGLLKAQQDSYYSVNYSRARALGMGAASVAVAGGLESVFYNPAAFHLIDISQGKRLNFLFSPLASLGVYDFYQNDTQNKFSDKEWLNVFSVLPKAIVLSSPNWEFGLIFHEELELRRNQYPSRQFFEGINFFNYMVETAIVRVRLAEQVDFGGTLQYYTAIIDDTLRNGTGSSYGIYIQPSPKFDVGIVFITTPPKMKDIRLNYDRFEDETVNVGVSYHPFEQSTISFDVRNLTEEFQKTTREVHVGLEQGFWNQVYLRFGYYQNQFQKENFITAGFGLFNLNLLRIGKSKFCSPLLALNYAMMVNVNNWQHNKVHFLTFNLGF